MITFHKALMLALLYVLGTAHLSAGEQRDYKSDLVKIAARYLEGYSKSQHKAGDPDGVFIEDVVIPSVVNAVDSYKGKIPSAVRSDIYRFLIAGKSMASEELASLAGDMYRSSPQQFCSDISKQSQSNRRLLLQQATDGLALNGSKDGEVRCP